MKINKLIVFLIGLSLLLTACIPAKASTKTVITALNNNEKLIQQYYRGVKENCYLNPIAIIPSGAIFLTQEYCDTELQKSKNEDFYHQNKVIVSTEKDAYYLGLSDGCLFNPIGADTNDNFIFRTQNYCDTWIMKMKQLSIFEDNITSGDTLNIPKFLMTPQIEPISTRVEIKGL